MIRYKENTVTKSMMILIAGPYRSGTGDDPQKMAQNLARLESAALPIFDKGHVPMIGEWAALPILRGAGGGQPGSASYDRIMHPTAHRLLQHCDGVLRLRGPRLAQITMCASRASVASRFGTVWMRCRRRHLTKRLCRTVVVDLFAPEGQARMGKAKGGRCIR